MDQTEIAQRIEAFLRASFQISDKDNGFDHHVDLFESGYVDSVGIIETLSFISAEFDIEVPDDALLSEDFSTISGISAIIRDLLRFEKGHAPTQVA